MAAVGGIERIVGRLLGSVGGPLGLFSRVTYFLESACAGAADSENSDKGKNGQPGNLMSFTDIVVSPSIS